MHYKFLVFGHMSSENSVTEASSNEEPIKLADDKGKKYPVYLKGLLRFFFLGLKQV